ncbi:MAG: translocation/assembly module TamB domain-containing protein, partial [Terrimicrobiaceae bacterium]
EKDKTSVVMQATLADSGIRLNDMEIFQGKKRLASGELFLPLNPFDMISGKKFSEAILPATALHARLQTVGDLDIAELFLSFGQTSPILGSLRGEILASGKPDAMVIQAEVRGRGLQPTGGPAPPSELSLTLDAREGVANASGTLQPKGLSPITIALTSPLGLTTGPDGLPRLMDPEGRLIGKIHIPRTELEVLRPFLPPLKSQTGSLSAQIDIGGTVASPTLLGSLLLENGRIEVAEGIPSLDNLQASLRFENQGLQIQTFTGEVGAGPFQISGGISLLDFRNPVYDLKLEGSKVLLHRSTDLRLRSDIRLSAKGSNEGGRIEGDVGIVDGRLFRRLEITPLIAPSPSEAARPFIAPSFSGLVPAPFDAWTVQVSIKNTTPFQIIGNIASGEIQPDLVVTGTLGKPWPLGSVLLYGARAFLPFTTMDIREGRIDFVESDPWMPILDVRGFAEALDYDIRLHAFGPLSQGNLTLRSDPPLSQEAIILLLTTGIAPGFHAGAGFGEAAVGQGGMLLLRTLLRQFDIQGLDTESLLNRLQVSAVPPKLPGDSAGLRARLQIWRGLSVMTEQDDLGFYNIGATYRFRFR